MGLLTAALIVGAGSAAMGVAGARKDRKAQEAAMRKQETSAREANMLNQTKDDSGADIVLGTDETKGGARRTFSTRATPRVMKPVMPTRPTLGSIFDKVGAR